MSIFHPTPSSPIILYLLLLPKAKTAAIPRRADSSIPVHGDLDPAKSHKPLSNIQRKRQEARKALIKLGFLQMSVASGPAKTMTPHSPWKKANGTTDETSSNADENFLTQPLLLASHCKPSM